MKTKLMLSAFTAFLFRVGENGDLIFGGIVGLHSAGELDVVHGFELLGADGTYVNVQAEARGRQVILEGRGRSVRYAWKDNPVEADCRARATALPAVPFELAAD